MRITGARSDGASAGQNGRGARPAAGAAAALAPPPPGDAPEAHAHLLALEGQGSHSQSAAAGNGGGAVGGRVLVLNATYEPINVCSIRRAVVLLLKEKAEVVERGVRSLHAESLTLARPVVIRLVAYVRVPHRAQRRKITRRAVFARDGWACQYCGSRSNLTVDHVIPRSKGGESSWENIVASCGPCNRRKGDRLPSQVGMELRRAPRTPRAEIFIHVSSPSIPTAWRPYLPLAA